MTSSIKYVGYAFAFGAIIFYACTKDRVELQPVTALDCTESISYVEDIKPLVDQNCSTSGCHDATASGGHTLTSYTAVHDQADLIIRTIKHEPGVTAMPFASPKLSDSLIRKFECWIVQGKPENE